jgi:glucosamine-6-phosphate deaminase
MTRPLSTIAPDWWDYTTLEKEILDDAMRLDERALAGLQRPGFAIHFYDSLTEFYLAEALEYINAWKESSSDNPVGICGPIGPTEQLPLVARLVNDLGLDLARLDAHFWGMDEWYLNGRAAPADHPLSFARADRELCFDRVRPELAMPAANLHFPGDDVSIYEKSYSGVRCAVMQGGQGEVKHWAFNDPVRRQGAFKDAPPSPQEYRKLGTRVVELHPLTLIQNARTSGGGNIPLVPTHALTVGPQQTWQAEKVSIWHPGTHDNPFGMRLTALMISQGLADSAVPMSLLADHPNVHFHYLRSAIGTCQAEMH